MPICHEQRGSLGNATAIWYIRTVFRLRLWYTIHCMTFVPSDADVKFYFGKSVCREHTRWWDGAVGHLFEQRCTFNMSRRMPARILISHGLPSLNVCILYLVYLTGGGMSAGSSSNSFTWTSAEVVSSFMTSVEFGPTPDLPLIAGSHHRL